jgi:hypothetical protein
MNRLASSHYPEPRESWWKRNWKWFVPTGCLSMIILAGFAIFFFISSFMKNSTPFIEALKTATTNEYVLDALGEPITQEGLVQGELFYENSDGEADLFIPLKGSKTSGTIRVIANKYDGTWEFSRITLSIESTGEVIDLLEKE